MTVVSYTANFRLRKILFNSRGWHTDEWLNLDTIDGLLDSAVGNVTPFSSAPTGTPDALALDFTPNITYTNGQLISFIAGASNTGAVTVNCDGLGAKALKAANGATLTAATLLAGMYVRAIFSSSLDCFTMIYPGTATLVDNVFSSGASGVTTPSDVDDVIIENNGHAGLSINTPPGFVGTVNFGRPLSPSAGRVKYDHSLDLLGFHAGGNEVATLDPTGKLVLDGVRRDANSFVFAMQAYTAATNLPTTGTKIKFGTIRDSSGDGAYNTTTGDYTAPVSGAYLIQYQVWVYAAAGAGNTTVRKEVPAVSYLSTDTSCFSTTDSTTGIPTGFMGIFPLNAGDKLSVEYTGTAAAKWKGHLTIMLIQPD